MATIWTSGLARIGPISRIAWVPNPMQARVIFSLGATYPAPPSTCRGVMVKAVAATPPVTMNWGRERLRGGDGLLVSLGSFGCESLVFIRRRFILPAYQFFRTRERAASPNFG